MHEEFLGLYQLTDTSASTLVAVIKDCLLRMNLNISRCRGQCYDGAGSMAGCRNGVASRILSEEPCALFAHCYGHSVNLAVSDTIKQCKLIIDSLDIRFEISKLIKFSPKRDAIFQKLKAELAVMVLCPTRWAVRANSLKSVLGNYNVLMSVWDETVEGRAVRGIQSCVIGVRSQM